MTIHLEFLFILLVLFQIKHFLADFVFQNVWMLQKSQPGWNFVPPLSLHCGIHAVSTLAIVLYIQPSLWWLSLVDFAIHFVMDRVKAGPRYMGRWSDVRSHGYWICFGFDQMVHHLTHLYICWVLIQPVS